MTAVEAGLCSVTLRRSSVDEVARIAASCSIAAVEWGADVHVPPGDLAAARRAAAATVSAGARCASYGSYLWARAVHGDGDGDGDVRRVLDTAVELGAANVRVWASNDVSDIAERLARAAEAAAERDLTLSLEFHGGTRTASVDGTLDLLHAVGAANVFAYWQPPYWAPVPDRAADTARLIEHLSHLHVYEWEADGTRLPLVCGASAWPAVLEVAGSSAGRWGATRVAFLEFVTGDDPAALARDAATLGSWIEAVAP